MRREKNILPTRLLEKKIIDDQKSPTPPPPPRVKWSALNKRPKFGKYWSDVIDLDNFLLWDFP